MQINWLCFSLTHSVVYQLGTVMPAKESRVVEYKAGGGNYTTNILPAHIDKYGSAFLNSSGGTLCIGVNDDGKDNHIMFLITSSYTYFNIYKDFFQHGAGVVAGVCATYRARERIRSLIRDQFSRFTPPVGDHLYMLADSPTVIYSTLFTIAFHSSLNKYRIEFVPCNRQDIYVIEVHIKPGERGEIYSDSDNKVCS